MAIGFITRRRRYNVVRQPIRQAGTIIGFIVRRSDGTTVIEWKGGHRPAGA